MQENTRDISIFKRRILEYLEAKGLSKASFYREAGAPNGILSQKNGISEENLLRFTSAYPDVNLWWLHHGEGAMFVDESPAANAGRGYSLKSEPIVYPAIEETFENNVADIVVQPDEWFSDGDSVHVQSVPLYEWDSATGLSILFSGSGAVVIGPLVLPNLPPCDGALYVRGDAMLPFLKTGDIVAYKKIDPDSGHIEWNKMYLLSYETPAGECTVVRYIHRADDQAYVQLLDPDPHHPIRIVAMRAIRALALVKATVRFNTMG